MAMDLIEVSAGHGHIVAFDGRVLEVFGASPRRFHVNLLSVTVLAPDKHGNRSVIFTQADADTVLQLDQQGYEQLQSVLEAVDSARAVRVASGASRSGPGQPG
jgi:hypothetical protein